MYVELTIHMEVGMNNLFRELLYKQYLFLQLQQLLIQLHHHLLIFLFLVQRLYIIRPEIRTGMLYTGKNTKIELKDGQKFTLVNEDITGDEWLLFEYLFHRFHLILFLLDVYHLSF